MADLFGIDIAGLVTEHVAPGLHDVIVRTYQHGDRVPGQLASGRQRVPTEHTGVKGIWEDISPALVDGTQILVNDRIAMLIGGTLPPGLSINTNDEIEIESIKLFAIRLLSRDPASATYRYLCRDRKGPDGA